MQLPKSIFDVLFLLFVVIATMLLTGAWATKEMCKFVKTTCKTCVAVGCSWTADDSNCLKNCGKVDDGAYCVLTKVKCPTKKPMKKPTKKPTKKPAKKTN